MESERLMVLISRTSVATAGVDGVRQDLYAAINKSETVSQNKYNQQNVFKCRVNVVFFSTVNTIHVMNNKPYKRFYFIKFGNNDKKGV